MRAYSELYLDDAKKHLGSMADYAVNVCGVDPDEFFELFAISGYAYQFSHGNPSVVSGCSGIELARKVLDMSYAHAADAYPEPAYARSKSAEYWAGWALAHYQWWSGRTLGSIHRAVPFSEMVSLYGVYHEMDVMRFCEEVERRYEERSRETNLKTFRERAGLSQSQLSRKSGVSLRSIQMYEQRVNDIDKAQAHALCKMACVLGCSMEDLLESPLTVGE